MIFDNIVIYDPGSKRYASVTKGRLNVNSLISGDIQIGAVEIKDASTDNRARILVNASGDYGMEVIPMEVNPLHTSRANEAYTLTRDGNEYITKIQKIINGTTYSKDFSRNGSGYVTSITAWY